jgi:hypothetical protein
VHVYNPSTLEAESGRLFEASLSYTDPVSKKKKVCGGHPGAKFSSKKSILLAQTIIQSQ